MANIFELFGEIIIKNTDANKKIDETTGKAKDLADALNKAGDGAKDAGEQFEDAGDKADTAGDKFGKEGKFSAGAVALGNLLSELADKAWDLSKQLFDMGISYNSNMEHYHASVSSMLGGDAESAAKLIGQLQELSVNTPLHFLDLMKNTQSMLAYGVAADSVVDLLTMMGNITLGDTNKLNSLAYAFSQVVGYGYLRAQETNQMINAGFPVWELLAESMGKTAKELHIMSEEGQILPEHIIEAMQLATSEGGKFYNQMDTMMTTYNAKWEKIQETGEITAGALTEPLFKLLRDEAFPRIQETLESFLSFLQENPELLQSWVDSISDFAVNGFSKITEGLQWIISNKGAVETAFTVITTAIAGCFAATHPLAAAIATLLYSFGELKRMSDEEKEKNQAKSEVYVRTGKEGEFAIYRRGDYKSNQTDQVLNDIKSTYSDSDLKVMEQMVPRTFYTMEEFNKWKKKYGEIFYLFCQTYENESLENVQAWWNVVRPNIEKQYLMRDDAIANPDKYVRETLSEYGRMALTPSGLSLYEMPDPDASADEILKWFETASPELLQLFCLEPPDPSLSKKQIEEWWAGVAPTLYVKYNLGGPDIYNYGKAIAADTITGGFATGLDFVPRDNFIARLHKGEAVLTAKENSEYRQMKNGGDVGAAIAQLTDAINELQEGFQTNMNLYVNKKHVASALSRDMGRSIGNREYTLVRGMGG